MTNNIEVIYLDIFTKFLEILVIWSKAAVLLTNLHKDKE